MIALGLLLIALGTLLDHFIFAPEPSWSSLERHLEQFLGRSCVYVDFGAFPEPKLDLPEGQKH